MSEIKNRELSQFSSFLHVDNDSQNIGIASDATPYIGIGTVNPEAKVHIVGDVKIVGVVTASNIDVTTLTIGNAISASGSINILAGASLNYSGIGTINSLVASSATVTNLTAIAGTFANLYASNAYINSGIVTNLGGTSLNYSGISTINGVKILSGIISATNSGIVTYYGDGSKLSGLDSIIAGIGINISTGNVGYGVTLLNLRGSGISTVTVTSGIATINVIGQSASGLSGYVQYNTNGNFDSSDNLRFNGNDLNVAGVVTATSAVFGSTVRIFDGTLTATGIVSAVSATFGNAIIGTAVTITSSGIRAAGIVTSIGGFVGNVTGNASTATLATNAQGLTGTPNITVGNITASNISVSGIITATDFNSTSDQNLKENIITFENALDIVSQLRGVKFNWKETHTPSIGVIAQELEEILPELVTNTHPKTVNYNGIIGVLIEAIKELQAEVKKLK